MTRLAIFLGTSLLFGTISAGLSDWGNPHRPPGKRDLVVIGICAGACMLTISWLMDLYA